VGLDSHTVLDAANGESAQTAKGKASRNAALGAAFHASS